jgi:hypothetical protein
MVTSGCTAARFSVNCAALPRTHPTCVTPPPALVTNKGAQRFRNRACRLLLAGTLPSLPWTAESRAK